MALKARRVDVKPGQILWMKDHRRWFPIIVETLTMGGRGLKITFRRSDGTLGKHHLEALYRQPPLGSPVVSSRPLASHREASSTDRIEVEAHDGHRLNPCTRIKARALVGLGLAVWVDPEVRVRLQYNVWAGRQMSRQIIHRDGRRCVYCGQPATSMDHLLGHARGGLTQPDNLVAACATCNQARGDRPLEEWLIEHPVGIDHPMIAAYLASGGTPAHQDYMDAIFSQGVPDPSVCVSADDVNRWLKLYQQRNPEGWAQLIRDNEQ